MLTLLFWMLAGLLGLKIGWNFAIMVYLWAYLRRNVQLYPRGVDLYLFVEWGLLLALCTGILLSYGHGFVLLRWMRHFAQRNGIAE